MKKAIYLYLMLLLLTGVFYPLLVTGIVYLVFPQEASGSFIFTDKWSGSRLIGQKFVSDRYFWPRPSAIDYQPIPSGGSNLGPTSLELKNLVAERRKRFSAEPPSDLLYASASGLDPHISPSAAHFQAGRVAKARGVSQEKVEELIQQLTVPPRFGFLGKSTVNVLDLNLLLDEKTK